MTQSHNSSQSRTPRVWINLASALTLAIALTPLPAFAQTNTFPSSGNVGIGTTSPSFPLHVKGNVSGGMMEVENSNYPVAIMQRDDTGSTGILTNLNLLAKTTSTSVQAGYGTVLGFWVYDGNNTGYNLANIGAVTDGSLAGNLVFNTTTSGSLTERMRILNNGNVGIGTTRSMTA